MEGDKFQEEIKCLIEVKRKNITRFLGYCADTQGRVVDFEGSFVMADVRRQFLCFKYRHKDTYSGVEWREHYQIIKGNCKGLWYLHRNHIVHLDLKPDNILLDDNMVPIADFGLSKYFRAGLSFQNLDEHHASRGLEWGKRYLIVKGICEGLYYLEEESIIHLDLKPANISMDNNMLPKITDFGLPRLVYKNAYGYEWRECYDIIEGICEGLSYLHKNHIVHFNLKPTNILYGIYYGS
ncbi:unnamed protein product [Triticum turgidum subsp. durum]|uniref:Protein kinase domain-containing protein n=1 Tax=Triticum turgidum subsp. durum TaxID=4567 RepID=A0A9R1B3G5_TRITD|nr:unnamed protein product [Triticum turgidum subsp. durum]